MSSGKPSFLTSIAGLLTGVAALITAIVGLLALIGKDNPPSVSETRRSRPSVVSSSPFPAPATAPEMDTCSEQGPLMTDPFGRSHATVFCDLFREAIGHVDTDGSSPMTGKLQPGRYPMVCQQIGAENPVTTNNDGSPNRNRWWLWTTVASGDGLAGGWIPATSVKQGRDYEHVPGVAYCNVDGLP